MLEDQESRKVTLEYCRLEFKTSVSCCVFIFVLWVLEIATTAVTPANECELPFNFYIVLLPLNGSFLNWGLNYIYQRLLTACAASFFLAFVPITFIMMNHSCLEVDAAILKVSGDNRLFKKSKDQKSLELETRLKGLVERTLIFWNSRKMFKICCSLTFSSNIPSSRSYSAAVCCQLSKKQRVRWR